jgi:pathogenesis-related protein 1
MHLPKSISLLHFFLPLFFTAHAQNIPAKTGSQFSTGDAQQFLEHHNQARKELNIPPLRWNPQLAAYAQEWANYLANKKKCKMIHRYELKQNEEGYGENIFWGSSAKFFTALDASIAWYNEKVKYNGEPISWEGLPKTGHYTQMIWEKTTDVGAGKAVCPSGAIIIVANYNPGGNIIGSNPF